MSNLRETCTKYTNADGQTVFRIEMVENPPSKIIMDPDSDTDRDYVANIEPDDLPLWIKVGKFVLYIKHTAEGVIVEGNTELSPQMGLEPVAQMQLWNIDIPEE